MGFQVRIFNSIRFIWLRFIWFHFVLFCVFVYRFSLRFDFIFICRRWKIVRISFDINRTREREGDGERKRESSSIASCPALPLIVFATMVMHIYGAQGSERGFREGREGESVACCEGRLICFDFLFVWQTAKIFNYMSKSVFRYVRHVNRNQLAVPTAVCPFHCHHLNPLSSTSCPFHLTLPLSLPFTNLLTIFGG